MSESRVRVKRIGYIKSEKSMKNNVGTKVSSYFVLTSIIWFIFKLVIDLKYSRKEMNSNVLQVKYLEKNYTKSGLKYILQWTSSTNVPFVYMGVGQSGFISRNCSHVNCFVTDNRSYLGDYTNFDVIVFAAPEARFLHIPKRLYRNQLPERRSLHQKYVFSSIESADNYPVCSKFFDDYYNWTWTYRLDSDAIWGYIAIRDTNNKIIGPKKEMHWMKLEDMESVSNKTKMILSTKKKAAAWFVSNCYTRSYREKFVKELKFRLAKFNLTVDIYGGCSLKKCPKDNDKCYKMIQKNYYFYLSLENSFAEDYVTEKILHALKYYAIPIVYGGANYTRFMPDGIYLNAKELGVARLAEKMNELIKNSNLYAEYFRWQNHYSYHYRYESEETDDYCKFCTMLNNKDLVAKTSVYTDLRHWWDPSNRCKFTKLRRG